MKKKLTSSSSSPSTSSSTTSWTQSPPQSPPSRRHNPLVLFFSFDYVPLCFLYRPTFRWMENLKWFFLLSVVETSKIHHSVLTILWLPTLLDRKLPTPEARTPEPGPLLPHRMTINFAPSTTSPVHFSNEQSTRKNKCALTFPPGTRPNGYTNEG